LCLQRSPYCKSRTLSVSKRLISILLNLPRSDKQVTLFKRKANGTRQVTFRKRIKWLARTHNNPRFLKIHYRTFRHCKALREYHKTKSILHVKKILGHRNIMNTQRYVELYTEIYGDLKPENYISKAASTKHERQMLIESGFEWVGQDNDGLTYFRKPK